LVVEDSVFLCVFTDTIDTDQALLRDRIALLDDSLLRFDRHRFGALSCQQVLLHSLWINETLLKVLTTIVKRETIMLLFLNLNHVIEYLDREVTICFEIDLWVLAHTHALCVCPLSYRLLG